MVKEPFNTVRYYISHTLRPEQREQLADILNTAGASAVALNDTALTHFVSNSLPNDDSLECLPDDSPAHLVTPTWVARSRILDAPQPAEFYSPDPAQIFSGVTATATDLSASDAEVMCAAISALGGQWRSALTRDVTHVFALAPGSQKYETAMHFREQTGMIVLVPHWYEDSLRLGIRGLPTAEYEWPEPGVFKGDWSTRKDDVDVPKPYRVSGEKKPLFDAALAVRNDLPVARAPPRNIWDGLRVLLGVSLGLSDGQRIAHEEDIRREGGVIVEFDTTKVGKELAEAEAERVEEADVLVTAYRSGPAFVKAYKANKTIGTLSWLWYCRATGTVSRPTEQLTHYPVPIKPVEGFSNHVITITNYTGKHRDYLKKLIMVMGAEFTASMSPKNTVVIAAYVSGTKAEKATSWSIPVVNHTWLEDCFVQWRNLTPAQERYINFPPRMDFSELITERSMGGRVMLEAAELDALEKEGLGDEAAGQAESGNTGIKPKSGGKENRPPSGTNNSTRERREVEAVVGAKDDPADVSMGEFLETDIKIGESSARTKRKVEDAVDVVEDGDGRPKHVGSSPRKYQSVAKAMRRRGAIRPNSDSGEDAVGPSSSVSPGKRRARVVKPNGRAHADSDQDEDVELVSEAKAASASPARAKRQGPPGKRVAILVSPKSVDMDIDTPSKSRSAAISRSVNQSSARTMKIGPPKSAKKLARRVAEADTGQGDEDVEASTRTLKTPTKSARSAVSEPTKPDSPAMSSRSAKKQMSVLVPTVAEVYSSPSKKKTLEKMQSVTAVAPESPISLEKRGRPSRAQSSTGSVHFSPSPPPPPKTRRKAVAVTPEAGPSHVEAPATVQRTPSRRAAANKATQKLRNEIMPDVVNFQKQLKNGTVRGAWESDVSSAKGKEKAREVDGAKPIPDRGRGRKRVSLGDTDVEPRTEDDGERPDKKRQRTSSTKDGKPASKTRNQRRSSGKAHHDGNDDSEMASDVEGAQSTSRSKPVSRGKGDLGGALSGLNAMKIMTTQITMSDEVAKFLKKLGVQTTTKPSECTHLVARSLVRTEKFLCAVARAPFVLSEKWLLSSVAAKELLPEDKFALKDPASEERFGFKLVDALDRAKANGGKLFGSMTFYVTPHVPVDTKLLKNVVAACGGQLLTQTPSVRILSGHDDRYVISSPSDRSIWRPLAQAGHTIYDHELILTSALKQKIDWDNPAYLVSDSD